MAAVIVAAGEGGRLGGRTPKQFLALGEIPVLEWSVRAFGGHSSIGELVVVLPPDRTSLLPDWLPPEVTVARGGATRGASVRAGLAALKGEPECVLVHDGARPFASTELISRVIEAARGGPAIPVIPIDDTVKRVDESGFVVETLMRDTLRRAQTPQGFPLGVLVRAHAAAEASSESTDDAVLCERLGVPVSTVEGDPHNVKITTPHDLAWARWMVENRLIVPGD